MNNNQTTFEPMTGQAFQPQSNGNMGGNANVQPNQTMNLQNNNGVSQQVQQANTQAAQVNIQQGQTNNQVGQVNAQPQPINNQNGQVNTQVSNEDVMNQMKNIATVDQSKEAFINNTQAATQKNTGENPPKVNYVFVAIVFVIILAAILFLFPYLQKNF